MIAKSFRTADGLFALVCRWAAEEAGAPALRDAHRALSYEALREAVDVTADLLAARGLGPGDRLAVVGENGVAGAVLLLAAQSLGAWPALINARLPGAEIASLLEIADPRLVAFAPEGSAAAARHAAEAVAAPVETPAGLVFLAPAAEAPAEPDEPDPARRCGLLLFTSGTTGRPKAVMLSVAALVALGERLARARGIRRSDAAAGAAPLSHIMGMGVLASALVAGASVELLPRLDVPEMASHIRDGRMAQMSVVPTVYTRLVEHVAASGLDMAGHGLRYASSGGAPLDATLKARFEAIFGIPLVNAYGMTECAPFTRTAQRFGLAADCIGAPEEGVEARIVGPSGDLPDGEVGELWGRTSSAMMGYYRDAAATAAAMRPEGWVATGDLARRDPDGTISIVGRAKEMIIRSGFNVYPAEVETALNAHPDVVQSAVIGRPAGEGNEEVVAFVQVRPGAAPDAAAIERHVRARLAAYKVPELIVVRDALPYGGTGKILKRALADELDAGLIRP